MNATSNLNVLEVEWASLRFSNKHRCPKCSSLIYSRKSLSCGICGVALPEGIRLEQRERLRIEEMLEDERRRHRQWLSRREETTVLGLRFS